MRAELLRHAVPLPDHRLIERSFSLADGRIGFSHLLAADPCLTAIVCGNDVLALGALFDAQAMGLTVPDDISISVLMASNLASLPCRA